MSIFDIISLFGGLAMFLYGMRLMGDGLKEGSTGTLKKALEKVTNNPFKAFLLGLFVTAVIQSSTGMIVITSGLVGAGIITLHQSLGIIVGANIGTTVTGQIIRLLDVDSGGSTFLRFLQPSTLAPIALILGIVCIMFLKFKSSKTIGSVAMGFGILFSGLLNMTASVHVLTESGVFDPFFASLSDNPLIGYLTGFVIAFILQSSSATVGILQAFSMAGGFTFSSIYPVILGIYLGDCLTTAMVCSIGANKEAKRVGAVNVLYNLCETVVVFVLVGIGHGTGLLRGLWSAPIFSGGIANTNTVFNSICAVIILPFVGILEKAAEKIVKDKKARGGTSEPYGDLLSELNPVFITSPAIAFRGCYDVLCKMYDLSVENIRRAFALIRNYDEDSAAKINEVEDCIDLMADKVSKYLLDISPSVKQDLHVHIMDQYYKVVTEFERLGDHATNIAETAADMNKNQNTFSEEAMRELYVLEEILCHIFDYTTLAFKRRDVESARHIEPLEEVVDDMVNALRDNHLARMRSGLCNGVSGTDFLNILSDAERISDVCSNVGVATVARVEPEYADKAHGYISSLHQGANQEFNKEYELAHERYFSLLK